MSLQLKTRHKIERQFHDNWAKSVDIQSLFYLEAFTSPAAIENRAALKFLRPLKGKKILDLGCGLGDASIYLAKKGASVSSIDISPEMIKVTRRLATQHQVNRQISATVMLAEKLSFPDNHFDYIYGNGVLHHVDIPKAIKEIHRVLRPKGRAFFIEPLPNNPAINLYRLLADKVRTPTERPISHQDMQIISQTIPNIKIEGFHLFTLLIFVYYFLVERINPNQERYWKKILIDGRRLRGPFNFLHSVDRLVLKIIPQLKWFTWNLGISLQK